MVKALRSFAYVYNPSNQRTLRREADGSYWRYEFDSLGQVKSGKKYWADGTPVAGQQFEYGFDDIGNRKQTKAGGDENGLNFRTNTYSANLLNQYTNRQVQGAVDVIGVAMATNTVTVNTAATYRKGEYFRKQLTADNSTVPVWLQVDVAAPNESTVTRHEFVPKTPETFSYDFDGNMLSDGRWNYTWDAENRLIAVESPYTFPDDKKLRLEFQYDHQWRRTQKIVSTWDSGTWSWVPQSTNRFIYDGWNLIAVLDRQSTVLQSFTWGTDLSGTLQGAGGVGGLLSMRVHSGANAGTYFYCYDGNGNVAALVKSDGTLAAQYEYGPFGELVRATGPLAELNPFCFSTKFSDCETGYYYYGYRFYDAQTGRWVGRDPVEERGGLNLYGFLRNDPVSLRDVLGRSVDPNAIIAPDTAVEFSRLGPRFVNDWLMGILRSDFGRVTYDWLRVRSTYVALSLNAYYNWPGGSGNGFNKFIFTCNCGWIDSGHFWASAFGGYALDADRSFFLGVLVEEIQSLKVFGNGGWSASAYTAEDLPTDLLGSAFGQSLKGKDYNLIPRLFKKLLEDCGAVDPTKLTPEQWKLLRNEARQWTKDLTQNTDAYPTRGKACTALCPGTKQSQDDEFTRILQNLRR